MMKINKDKFRAGQWAIAALAMIVVIGYLSPQQIGVLVWSLTKLTLGAYLGYWIDRTIFYYARPGDFNITGGDTESWRIVCLCMLRRAAIMAAAIIALGLGV